MNIEKMLCNFNYCSDGNCEQYPECEIESRLPNICPKGKNGKKITGIINGLRLKEYKHQAQINSAELWMIKFRDTIRELRTENDRLQEKINSQYEGL